MEYPNLIYDFANRLPNPVMFIPLVLVLMGILILKYYKKFVKPDATDLLGFNEQKSWFISGIILVVFGGIISLILIPYSIRTYFRTKDIYESGKCVKIEGTVENYHPIPSTGHDFERFTIGDVEFKCSGYNLNDYGYPGDGAIRSGMHIRILYFQKGYDNIILKLETE